MGLIIRSLMEAINFYGQPNNKQREKEGERGEKKTQK